MKFKAYTGITWSNLELAELLNDEDSGVYYEKIRKHFGLHPFHLTNLHAALNEILSSNLNSYDPELKGFLLAYKNPKLLTSLGDTLYDTCFIHIDIEADFYIFRPEVGASLKGIVNKKGLSHIGVLVHKAFNVSIPKSDGEDDWPGDTVNIGHQIRFNVTYLDFNSRLPFIRGSLDKDDYLRGCKLPELCDRVTNRKVSFSQASDEGEDTFKKAHKFENIPRPFFTSDSESSSDEKIPITPKKYALQEKNVELIASPESNVNNDGKKKRKNSKHKSEDIEAAHDNQKSEESELSQEILYDASMNGDCDNDDWLSETKVVTHCSKKSKKPKLTSNRVEGNSSTELGESSKRKKSAESLEVERSDKGPKVKNERIRTSSSSSNVIEDESLKIMSEKVSKSEKRSDNRIDDSLTSDIMVNTQSPKKKSTKRFRSSNLEETSLVNIKQEESIPVNNTTNSQTTGTDDNSTQSRIKKKSKKHRRRSTEAENDSNGNDNANCNTSTPIIKTEKPDLTIFDPTSEIPPINIKTEILASDNERTSSKSSKKQKSKQAEQIKRGKTTQNSDFRNTIEEDDHMQKIKMEQQASTQSDSERHSPRKSKTRLKKTMPSETENENCIINVKQEKSIETNSTTNTENQGENGVSIRIKKKSKKQKLSTSVTVDEDETLTNQLGNISTKQQVNSTIFDSSAELPVIPIKQEPEHSGYESCQIEGDSKLNISLTNASSVNETISNLDDLEENSIKKKKKKRKHNSNITDTIKSEPTHQITIKTEDSDSNSRNKFNSLNNSEISPSKKKRTDELEDSTSDGQQTIKKRRQSKKSATSDNFTPKNIINENVQIKIERDVENQEAGQSKQDEQKHSKKSPHKHTKKSKIKRESAFDNGNIEIKIEESDCC